MSDTPTQTPNDSQADAQSFLQDDASNTTSAPAQEDSQKLGLPITDIQENAQSEIGRISSVANDVHEGERTFKNIVGLSEYGAAVGAVAGSYMAHQWYKKAEAKAEQAINKYMDDIIKTLETDSIYQEKIEKIKENKSKYETQQKIANDPEKPRADRAAATREAKELQKEGRGFTDKFLEDVKNDERVTKFKTTKKLHDAVNVFDAEPIKIKALKKFGETIEADDKFKNAFTQKLKTATAEIEGAKGNFVNAMNKAQVPSDEITKISGWIDEGNIEDVDAFFKGRNPNLLKGKPFQDLQKSFNSDSLKNLDEIVKEARIANGFKTQNAYREIIEARGVIPAAKLADTPLEAAALAETMAKTSKSSKALSKLLKAGGKSLPFVGGAAAVGFIVMGTDDLRGDTKTQEAIREFQKQVENAGDGGIKSVKCTASPKQKKEALDFCKANTTDPEELKLLNAANGDFAEYLIKSGKIKIPPIQGATDQDSALSQEWKTSVLDQIKENINNRMYNDLIALHQQKGKETNQMAAGTEENSLTKPEETTGSGESEKKPKEENSKPSKADALALDVAKGEVDKIGGRLEEMDKELADEKDSAKRKELEKEQEDERQQLEARKQALEALIARQNSETKKALPAEDEKISGGNAAKGARGGLSGASGGLSGALSGMNPQGGMVPVSTGGTGVTNKPDDAAINNLMAGAQAEQQEESWWSRNKTWLLWTLGGLVLGVVGFLGFKKGGWWNKEKKSTPTPTPTAETASVATAAGLLNTNTNTNMNTNTGSTLENSAVKVNTNKIDQTNTVVNEAGRTL